MARAAGRDQLKPMERLIRILICLADGDLQPYRLRVGLMLVVGGPTAEMVEPADLRTPGPRWRS
jgi:hypothetical protein